MTIDTNQNKAFLFANIGLDAVEYDHTFTDGSEMLDYETSTIRKWLNDNFYNTAFNEFEKSIILETFVDNNQASTASTDEISTFGYNNTLDKVFLLSYYEIFAPEYSLQQHLNLQILATDYARIQGTYIYPQVENGDCCWWLRNPHPEYNGSVYIVTDSGSLTFSADPFYYGNAVAPALWIKL
jgi:hypothetical protein